MDQRVFGRRQWVRMAGLTAALGVATAPLAACMGTLLPTPQPFRRYEVASDVLFDFGSATLRPEASAALTDILAQIRSTYQFPAIRVEGHTDGIGSDAANDALSLRRAEAVRQWLIAAGVPAAVITTEGLGKRRPKAPEKLPNGADSPEGRARNRRVELVARPA